MIIYPNLERLIEARNYKKKDIAAALGITPRSLMNKLAGNTEFTWREVEILQARFFPDHFKETLMQRERS